MTTSSHSILSSDTTRMISPWISRALEALWLLAVLLVPLAFLERDYVLSEVLIAYVEVPKIALLRTLVALMAVLWIIEWGIQGRLVVSGALGLLIGALGMLMGESLFLIVLFGAAGVLLCGLGWFFSGERPRFQPGEWPGGLRGWLGERPSRWLILAVWFFLGSTLLSTFFSGSFNVSMWGEVPGQDGYPAYTVLAYGLLFAVIATHLKTQAQMWRLIGAIATMGTLLTTYAVLQHYGHDFLNLIEQSGGGPSEVSVTMGNSLFAGATMMMVVPVTLAAAVLSAGERLWAPGGSRQSLRSFVISLGLACLWGAVLSVQLLGIAFTAARGPWVGMVVALVCVLGLAAIFAGWRTLGRAGVMLGLSVVFGVALLQGLGSISLLGFGPWFGVIIPLGGVLVLALIYADWRLLSRAVLGIGLAAALAVGLLLAVSWYKDDNRVAALDANPQAAGSGSPTGAVVAGFSSIKGEVLGGFATGRATHWTTSWRLIWDRPWFDFDTLSVPWLRPIVGYGPDLFRYTYLLESRSEGPEVVPLEPDHAHNFFIHQAVEQGLLGLLSSLGLFAAAFYVGGYVILRKSSQYSLFHKLILIGLVATIMGRFVEMMVGVARVSDLTILWVLLAAVAALPGILQGQAAVPEEGPKRRDRRRRNQLLTSTSSATSPSDGRVIWRLGIVVALILMIGILTWVKGINNVLAAVKVGNAVERFQEGDYQAALSDLDRAIDLSPSIPVYYNHKAAVYFAYQINPLIPPESACSAQDDIRYDVCLAALAHESNLQGVSRRPFYYRSHMALANTAFNLKLDDQATQYYEEVLALVPDSWKARDNLAEVYLDTGQAEAALRFIEESLAITKGTNHSARAQFLKGKAHQTLGDSEKAAASLERTLELRPFADYALEASQILAESYASLGRSGSAAELFFQLGETLWNRVKVEQSTHTVTRAGASEEDAVEVPLEIVSRSVDDVLKATQFLRRSLEFGLSGDPELQAHQTLIDAYMGLGESEPAGESLFQLGEAYRKQDQLEKSAQAFERSLEVSKGPALARKVHAALADIYTALGRLKEAAVHRQQAER